MHEGDNGQTKKVQIEIEVFKSTKGTFVLKCVCYILCYLAEGTVPIDFILPSFSVMSGKIKELNSFVSRSKRSVCDY